ncbi:uncharacterized protein METZ01_LOCUS373014, partial [marine metagenome]
VNKPFYVNPVLISMEYAVRGSIAKRAAELKRLGRSIIPCNIGNPQALGQPPLSFYRQVLSLIEYPEIFNNKTQKIPSIFSDIALDYGRIIIEKLEIGTGGYSDSNGHEFIREAIAEFIDKRDDVLKNNGIRSNPDNIF